MEDSEDEDEQEEKGEVLEHEKVEEFGEDNNENVALIDNPFERSVDDRDSKSDRSQDPFEELRN